MRKDFSQPEVTLHVQMYNKVVINHNPSSPRIK